MSALITTTSPTMISRPSDTRTVGTLLFDRWFRPDWHYLGFLSRKDISGHATDLNLVIERLNDIHDSTSDQKIKALSRFCITKCTNMRDNIFTYHQSRL